MQINFQLYLLFFSLSHLTTFPHVILSQYCTQKAAEAFMLFFFFVVLNMCFGWKNLHKFALNIIFTIMSSRGRRHHHRSMQYLHSIFAHVKWERKKKWKGGVCVCSWILNEEGLLSKNSLHCFWWGEGKREGHMVRSKISKFSNFSKLIFLMFVSWTSPPPPLPSH